MGVGQLAGGLGSSSGFGTGCGLTLGGGLGQGTGGGFGNGVPLGIGGGLQLGSANIGLLRTPCHTHQQQQQQRLEGSGGLLSQHTVSNSLFTGKYTFPHAYSMDHVCFTRRAKYFKPY